MTIVSLVLIVLFLGFIAYCVFKFGSEIPAAFGILGSLNAPVPRVG